MLSGKRKQGNGNKREGGVYRWKKERKKKRGCMFIFNIIKFFSLQNTSRMFPAGAINDDIKINVSDLRDT